MQGARLSCSKILTLTKNNTGIIISLTLAVCALSDKPRFFYYLILTFRIPILMSHDELIEEFKAKLLTKKKKNQYRWAKRFLEMVIRL